MNILHKCELLYVLHFVEMYVKSLNSQIICASAVFWCFVSVRIRKLNSFTEVMSISNAKPSVLIAIYMLNQEQAKENAFLPFKI